MMLSPRPPGLHVQRGGCSTENWEHTLYVVDALESKKKHSRRPAGAGQEQRNTITKSMSVSLAEAACTGHARPRAHELYVKLKKTI